MKDIKLLIATFLDDHLSIIKTVQNMGLQKLKTSKKYKFNKKVLAAFCSLSVSGMALTAEPLKANETVDEVVVTGRQQALANADERKQKAESSVDSIVADDAGKLPDASITEVLQRVSGVSIVRFGSLGDPDHFSAQGTGIKVRGLSGVAARLNGREVFSSNNGRGLSWSDVTPEMMAAVDVYKSSTADLIEGGTGGQVDLRTKMPFDYHDGFKGAATLSESYGDLAKSTSPSGSLLLTDRWDSSIGDIGVLVDLSSSKFKSHDDWVRMEPFYKTRLDDGSDKYVPGGFDYGYDNFERNRTGTYVALQWAPSDELTIAQTVFSSHYKDFNTSQGLYVVAQNLAVDPTKSVFDKNGILLSTTDEYLRDNSSFTRQSSQLLGISGDTSYSKSASDTLDMSTSFEWNATDKLKIKGAFQAVNSSGDTQGYDVGPDFNFSGSYGLDLTKKFPTVTLNAADQTALSDPSKFDFGNSMDVFGTSRGQLRAVNVDADYVISEEGFFRSAKIGARYADRTEHDFNTVYNWTAFGKGWNGSNPVTFNNAQPSDWEVRTFNNFFRGEASLPTMSVLMPSYSMVERMDPATDHKNYGGTPFTPATDKQNWPYNFSDEENINTAFYGMVRFADDQGISGMPYSGNLGLRYVTDKSTSKGYYTQAASTAPFVMNGVLTSLASVGETRTGEQTTSKLLPSLNFKLDPIDKVNIRLGYNITMDQPGFYDLRSSGSTTPNLKKNTGQCTAIATASGTDNYQCADSAPSSFSSTSGNPLLKPVYSHNADFSVEWYPSQAASAHVALFDKSIDNWITYGISTKYVPVTFTLPTAQTVMEQVQSNDVFNSTAKATVKGFELGGRDFFTFLPSPWDGLGIDANYTYIDSKNPGDLYIDMNGVSHTDAPIQGMSKNNANLAFMYEKGAVSLRLAYNWRSKYLMGTHGNGTNGNYNYFTSAGVSTNVVYSLANFADSYGQVDLGGTYKFNNQASLSLQISNLTNATTKTLQYGYPGNEYLPRSWFTADRRAELIFGYNF